MLFEEWSYRCVTVFLVGLVLYWVKPMPHQYLSLGRKLFLQLPIMWADITIARLSYSLARGYPKPPCTQHCERVVIHSQGACKLYQKTGFISINLDLSLDLACCQVCPNDHKSPSVYMFLQWPLYCNCPLGFLPGSLSKWGTPDYHVIIAEAVTKDNHILCNIGLLNKF